MNRPVARLRDFGGGFMPSSVAREIEISATSARSIADPARQRDRSVAGAARQRPARARSDLGVRGEPATRHPDPGQEVSSITPCNFNNLSLRTIGNDVAVLQQQKLRFFSGLGHKI